MRRRGGGFRARRFRSRAKGRRCDPRRAHTRTQETHCECSVDRSPIAPRPHHSHATLIESEIAAGPDLMRSLLASATAAAATRATPRRLHADPVERRGLMRSNKQRTRAYGSERRSSTPREREPQQPSSLIASASLVLIWLETTARAAERDRIRRRIAV